MLEILNKDDYITDSVHKNLVIELDDGTTIDNVNIKSESMKLNEILMDSTQLQFGRCNSSQFSVTLADIASNIKGKTIKPHIVVGGNEINKSAEGNPITVTDSGNYPLIEFKEDGYIIQDGTPTPDAPIAIQGLGDDGMLTVQTIAGENLYDGGGTTTANIPLDAPLYDGDYIEYFADGTGQIVRTYEKVVFNGSESWEDRTSGYTGKTEGQCRYSVSVDKNYKHKAKCLSTIGFSGYVRVQDYSKNGVALFSLASSKTVYITCDKTSLTDFKTWLQSNPITVVYELAEPIITPLTAEQVNEFKKLMTFEGATRITNNDNANMTVKYKYNKALPLGVFTVKDVPRLSQTPYKQIIALDNMHKIDRDVTEWYNNLKFPMKQKAFRDSFFEYIGLEQVETSLLFDNLIINNPLADVGQINGRTIAEGLCELNATFGHCDRQGRFSYVSLDYMNIFPSNNTVPSDDIVPNIPIYMSNPNGIIEDINNLYIKASYEEYETQFIDRIMAIDDYGYQLANNDYGTNTYVLNNNYLLYGRDKDELIDIMNGFMSVISTISYRPAEISCKGLPYLELGDRVRANVKDDEILTYVFNRTLSGIQALRDTYSAEGEEYLVNDLNSIQTKIDNLNHSNERLKIEITKTSEGLKSKVSKGDVSSEISQESDEVRITGNRFVVDADNLSISKEGKLKATEAEISGSITSNDATITGGNIDVTAEDKETASVTVRNKYNNQEVGLATLAGNGLTLSEPTTSSYIRLFATATAPYNMVIDKGSSRMELSGSGMDFYDNSVAGGIGTHIGKSSIYTYGSLSVSGTKSREIETPNYGNRLEYCYEMPTPYFGDIGEGITDNEGICYIFIDDIFAETIDTNCEYQVFLQSYGDGTVYVSERNSSYFIVKGTPNMKFAWELKAVQRDYEMYRLDEPTQDEKVTVDYAQDSYDYLSSLLYDVESEVIIYE